MKSFLIPFVLGIVVATTPIDLESIIMAHPKFFIILWIVVMFFIAGDILNVVLKVIRNVKKMRSTDKLIKKFNEAKFKSTNDV